MGHFHHPFYNKETVSTPLFQVTGKLILTATSRDSHPELRSRRKTTNHDRNDEVVGHVGRH